MSVFSLPENIGIALLVVISTLVLLSYVLMVFLPQKKARLVIFPSVPLHLFLLNILFSLGATVDVVALAFLALLTLYLFLYAIRYYRTRKRQEDEL